jgi:hypothetical protein
MRSKADIGSMLLDNPRLLHFALMNRGCIAHRNQ